MSNTAKLDGLAEQIANLHDRCELLTIENAVMRQEIVELRRSHQQLQTAHHVLWESRMDEESRQTPRLP